MSLRAISALILLASFMLLPVPPADAADGDEAKGFAAWTGDLDGMEERRLIRILVPFSKTIYFIDGGEQLGTAVEFGAALEEWVNKGREKENERVRIAYVPLRRDHLIPALIDGKGDIIAANLTITPDRAEIVDFTVPVAKGISEILVTGPAAPPVSSWDDLAGGSIMVRPSSSYHAHLVALNDERAKSGKAPIGIEPAPEFLEDEDLLEMVDAGLLPWSVVDLHKAEIWAKVFDNLTAHPDLTLAVDGEIAWALRKQSPKLMTMLNDFVKEHKVGTTFGNIIKKRYYQSDRMVKAAVAAADLEKFKALRALFEKHAATYAFEPLLLAAQGYQESGLDQSERSERGAVGIMQMLPSTAADKAVAITGIEDSEDRNIEAGAKYMRHLSTTYVTEPGVTPFERMLLVLAAYNAGPGNLARMRRETAAMGLDPNVWFGNVENGAAKVIGRETVRYVSNIYKYYYAYSLYAAHNAEAAR